VTTGRTNAVNMYQYRSDGTLRDLREILQVN